MAWLLDRLRKKVEAGDDQPSHFDDLKYIVGNTSGLDIGNVPSPLDQRIGQMSQIGGSIMEIEIDNPATFQIDRPEIKNVIDQLGYDKVTLHGDKNLGFTAAYATRGQGVVGYNVVHRYFTTYLEQMASFRKEVNEIEGRFDVGYVNMHASNEQIPPREERLASDVSVDPFGNSITTINGEKEKNIYRNEKFREKMFDFFFLEVVEQPWRQYEQTFSDSDEDFRETWNKWKAKKADKLFFSNGIDTSERISLFETAASIDQGAEKEFLQNLDNYDLEEPIKIHISLETEDDETIEETEEIRNLEAISNIFRRETGRVFSNTARLSRDLFDLKNKNAVPEGIEPRVEGWDIPEKALDEKMDELVRDLWGRGNESSLSAQGKLQSLSRNLDIQNSQIFEEAQEENEVIEKARQAFAKPDNDKILKNLTQGRIRDDFNKESSLFFHIIPAWMQFADEEDENHQGWDAPKFIWDAIVESNNEKDRNLSNYNEYKDFLDESRENELNVIAAVAACYIWGHFTQKKDRFSNDAFRSPPDIPDEEVPELKGGEEGDYTWLEWMNMFNLKVNFEAMFGSPGQLTRLWRPKDIAVLCHAIN